MVHSCLACQNITLLTKLAKLVIDLFIKSMKVNNCLSCLFISITSFHIIHSSSYFIRITLIIITTLTKTMN